MDSEKGFPKVMSEIGNLKSVLMHRPGKELEKITPQNLDELLFDDIPWLKKMQMEHDAFARVLKSRGCHVYYYEDLLEEILCNPETKKKLVKETILDCGISGGAQKGAVEEFLMAKTAKELSQCVIEGLGKEELTLEGKDKTLADYVKGKHPFYIDPLPNLYFTRDPGTVIGRGLSISSMKTRARKRESSLLSHIYENHPIFDRKRVPLWYGHCSHDNMEGGDILVISERAVLIGLSERTSAGAVERIAGNLFKGDCGIREVYAVQIPSARAYMHLDTVFTMLDYDKFTIYPGIGRAVSVFGLTYAKGGGIHVKPMRGLKEAVKKALGLPAVEFIESGGGDRTAAAREQWNDGTNTLAIAPGVVVAYDRNEYSNQALRQRGIEVVEIEGSELVRGRGGPHCMSMPLVRE